MFGESGSRGAEKPVLSGRQIHEKDSFMEIENSLPRFRDPEKLMCDIKKKILKFLHPLATSEGASAFFHSLLQETTLYSHTKQQATLHSCLF